MARVSPALWAHATGHPPGQQPPQQRLHCLTSNFQCGWRQWLPPAAWALQPEAPRAPRAGVRPAEWTSVPCGAVWRVQVGRRGTALAAAAPVAVPVPNAPARRRCIDISLSTHPVQPTMWGSAAAPATAVAAAAASPAAAPCRSPAPRPQALALPAPARAPAPVCASWVAALAGCTRRSSWRA